MSDGLPPESVFRICEHMNADHADALLSYARAFGRVDDALTARLVAIDPHGMDLSVETTYGTVASRIAFDREVRDASDARATLIDLARAARNEAADSADAARGEAAHR